MLFKNMKTQSHSHVITYPIPSHHAYLPNLLVSGHGDVIEPINGIMASGSGGLFAESAARALATVPGLSAKEIALRSMKIASDLCVYTNDTYVMKEIDTEEPDEPVVQKKKEAIEESISVDLTKGKEDRNENPFCDTSIQGKAREGGTKGAEGDSYKLY